MIKNILITSDFLMTLEKEQSSNRRWVFDLLKRPILNSTGIAPIKFYSSLTDKSKFSRIEFFKKSNINLDINKIQFLFNEKKITKESIDYLSSYISKEDLIIGYELSEQTKYILNKMKIKYIDFWLHPVRFIDDILFGFYSNDKKIYSKLNEFHFNEEYFYNYATKIKIQSYKGWKRLNLSIPENSCFFIGQTLEDKAVSSNGEFLNILNFQDKIEEALLKYNKVFYIRHPYLKNGDEHILKYLKEKNISIVNYPIYNVLSHENVSKIFSISSSVIHEAKYFQKDCEFLYKPIFESGYDFSNKKYIPIFQDLISIYFWGRVLEPILDTEYNEKILFVNQKDMLRDMLGFYWSYRQVDKIEYMKTTLFAIDKKFQKINTEYNKILQIKNNLNIQKIKFIIKQNVSNFYKYFVRITKKTHMNNFNIIKRAKKEIDNHDIISFDIFDTLLIRKIFEPNDLFDFMEDKYNLEDFSNKRRKSRTLVEQKELEEIPLNLRYSLMGKKWNIPKNIIDKELNEEIDLLEQRNLLFYIYNYAIEKNKKVIFTSDTFFDRSFIEKILIDNGYLKYENLFLSSEHNSTKYTGHLYEVMLKQYDNNKIIHFGDNLHSDKKMAKKYDIDSFYIPSKNNFFNDKFFLSENELPNFKNSLKLSLYKGLISNKNDCINYTEKSFFNGNPYLLGYNLFGIIFFEFVNSLIKQSINDNVQDLYFLSRDGYIIKQVYDLLSNYYDKSPKSHYVYASRRSTTVSSLNNEEDILEIFNKKFTPCSIGVLFYNRLGIQLTEEDIEVIGEGNYNLNSVVEYEKDKEFIFDLIYYKKEDILLEAKLEQQNLYDYYEKQGFFEDKKIGIVDIGHEGSIQKNIYKAFGKKINGYYFASFEHIFDNVEKEGQEQWGYLCNRGCIEDFYKKNILFFESVFLDEETSFVKMENGKPVFLDLDKRETERLEFSRSVHKGILNFNNDFLSYNPKLFIYSEEESIEEVFSVVKSFLNNAPNNDLKLFVGLFFENNFNCRKNSDIISKNGISINASKSLWKQGAKMYINNSIPLKIFKQIFKIFI